MQKKLCVVVVKKLGKVVSVAYCARIKRVFTCKEKMGCQGNGHDSERTSVGDLGDESTLSVQ